MCLIKPGVLYDTVSAPDQQNLPIIAGCDPNAMLWQKQALKTRTTTPNLTPVLTRTGYQYHTTWVKGVPISHKGEVQIHVHGRPGIKSRLAAYELVGPNWQLNAINVQDLFSAVTVTQVWLDRSLVGHIPGCFAGLWHLVAFGWAFPGFSSPRQKKDTLVL